MYPWIILKRRIEAVLIFPFALLGRLIAAFRPLKEEYDLFFFFPFFHVGGAEKVHSEIVQQFPDKRIVIFFTKKSANAAMLPKFEGSNITIHNVSAYTDNKFLYFLNLIYRGILSAYINKQNPVVFNGQCNFAYKLSPHIRKGIKQVELIHSFCSFSFIRIPFIPFYSTTVMISRDAIQKHLELYQHYKIPAGYAERIELIMNGIPLPESNTLSGNSGLTGGGFASSAEHNALAAEGLQILYVGRGTAEKRPHLVAQIAKAAGVRAGFVGPVEDAIPQELRQYCTFYGEHTDPVVIDALYRQHQVIVITSSTEGFPMVIMEGMARGLAVLSTNVGDIPYHVHAQSGFLLEANQAEEGIVAQGADSIRQWQQNPALLQQMGTYNIRYAREHFGMEAFAKAYRRLLT